MTRLANLLNLAAGGLLACGLALQAADNAVAAENDVAATVDGRPITDGQVRREVERVLRGREASPAARQVLERQALEQLVSRQLILLYLQRQRQGASPQAVDLELARIEKRLAAEGKTLQQFLEQSELTRQQLRDALTWQIGWQRFLDRFVTDENLERHFQQQHREFDGTKLQVAHILWKADPQDTDAVEAARRQAAAVREQLDDKQLSFAEAVREHSQAPTADQGGDIGLIGRRRPMPEPFAKAAFALQPGEVSQPVVTPFGVHLILCQRVEPGRRRWQDVRAQVEQSLTQYLFDWAADQQRPHSKIVYRGPGEP